MLPLDAKHEPLNPNGGGSLISGRALTRWVGLLVGITIVTGKNRPMSRSGRNRESSVYFTSTQYTLEYYGVPGSEDERADGMICSACNTVLYMGR